MIGIIDVGVGNVESIANLTNKIGYQSKIVCNDSDLIDIDKLVIPGVGSFDTFIGALHKSGLFDKLKEFIIKNNIPTLGICVGAQVMGSSSEEGNTRGLSLLPMHCKDLKRISKDLPLPNIGWHQVSYDQASPLFKNISANNRFYFVHRYFFSLNSDVDVNSLSLSYSNYNQQFLSGISVGNLHAVQFHPEKSGSFGFSLFKNFMDI